MLAHLKWVTQRVTGILLVLSGLALAYGLAMLGQLSGIWPVIDGLYPGSLAAFWVLFAISRGLYGVLFIWLISLLKTRGERSEWFWFKKEKSYGWNDPPSVDKSMDIVAGVIVVWIVVVLSEFAIRLATATLPPFMPGN